MMFFCPFCGRRRFTCWPEFWPWQYDGDLFCSENCWICDSTKKQMERKGYKMAKMKKDGTPAKKPGPKAKKPTVTLMEETGAPGFTEEEVQAIKDAVPTVKVDGPLKIETKEPKKIEVVQEQKPLKPGLRGLNNSDFTVSAIKHPQLGEFYYDQKFNSVDWRSPEGEEISLHPAMWKELYMIIPDVMGILGVPDYE